MTELIKQLRDTRAHYIRCMKPNDEKKAFTFKGSRIYDQLKVTGMSAHCRVSTCSPGSHFECWMGAYPSKYSILQYLIVKGSKRDRTGSPCFPMFARTGRISYDGRFRYLCEISVHESARFDVLTLMASSYPARIPYKAIYDRYSGFLDPASKRILSNSGSEAAAMRLFTVDASPAPTKERE